MCSRTPTDPFVCFPSSDPSVNSLVADAAIFYEGKNSIWKYPKRENIKVFELEEGSLSEKSKDRATHQTASKWKFYRLQQAAKKRKKFQKAVRSRKYSQNAPVKMMAGRVFLNISTQASHRRSSQRCFVGKITSFVPDSTILML